MVWLLILLRFSLAQDCECQASWTSEEDCSGTQSGCTNCDNDPNGDWCLTVTSPCNEEAEPNDGWFYCSDSSDDSPPADDSPNDTPSGYTAIAESDCLSGSEFIFFDAGPATVEDCAGFCDWWIGCGGFSYTYDGSLSGRCVGKTTENCETNDGRSGMTWYTRDTLSTGDGQDFPPQPSFAFDDNMPAEPVGYHAFDKFDCFGGSEDVAYDAPDGTAELCAASCEMWMGCCGFTFQYPDDFSAGRCVLKTCECELATRMSSDIAMYVRDDGAVEDVSAASLASIGLAATAAISLFWM